LQDYILDVRELEAGFTRTVLGKLQIFEVFEPLVDVISIVDGDRRGMGR